MAAPAVERLAISSHQVWPCGLSWRLVGEDAEGAARVHQVLLGAGYIHQREETPVGTLGGGCCCCSHWAYSFPGDMQVRGSAHFHVMSLNLWWLRQSFLGGLPALAAFFLGGWGCLGCMLSAATASSSSSSSSGTAAATWWDLALKWLWFMPNQRSSAREAISLELRLILHASMWLLTSLGTGQLDQVQHLEKDAVLLPRGSKASMVSISWEGLLSPSSPLQMSLRHITASLGGEELQ